MLARQLLARETGTKQIIMITDGEPTAHITDNGMPFFNYPPVRETVEATLREVVRCTKEQIRINTFMLDADGSLRAFIEQMTQINRGRAFFTTPETSRRLRARRLHRAQEAPSPPAGAAPGDSHVARDSLKSPLAKSPCAMAE